jgi:2,4-dienoyl-CoA reductase (NADPH2)
MFNYIFYNITNPLYRKSRKGGDLFPNFLPAAHSEVLIFILMGEEEKMKLQRLFAPTQVGALQLKNKILMPAIHHLYTPEGYATERFNQHYWRRAEGGAGLIFVGGCRFDDYGASSMMMSLQRDEFIPGFKEFTDGMHARGAKVGVQLYHAGAYAHSIGIPGGKQALAPSAVLSKFTKEMPKEITLEEMQEVIRNWADGAVRAQKAGFDIVEIIASAGYLIPQFLSPVKNLRTDEYGGSWENRTRFAKEVVAAVRAAVGPDYPLSMRIAGNDFVKDSNTNEEAVEFSKLMEKCGIDLFNVTGGWHESIIPQVTGDLPRGGYAYLAEAVHKAVDIPVAVSNRINDPILAEKLLAFNVADMVSIGRPLIADPDWVVKAQEGRFDEIRRCVACNQGCLAKTFFMKPIECLVNGTAGREYLLKESKPASHKNILVIGAGPAGCEFAIQAAERGNSVTIWEKQAHIGGQLSMVATPPGKGEFKNLIRYYDAMLKKNGVEVFLGKEATSREIMQSNYDVVITATGMVPNAIPLPGKSEIPVYSAYDVLRDEAIPGTDVVVVGGGSVGCEAAQYMAHDAGSSAELIAFLLEHQAEKPEKVFSLLNTNRRNISIVDIVKIGAGFDPGTGWPVLKDLKRLHVKQYPFATIRDITDHSVVLTVTDKDTKERSDVEIPCDSIVMAVGAKQNDTLYNELRNMNVNVHNLGDSSQVGKVIDAIRQADELAYAL